MAYGFYGTLTVDNTKVSGSADLTNFPVLVSGTYDGTGGEPDIRTTGNGGNVENTDATGGASGGVTVPADLVFSPNTDGSSPYDFEIEKYDATTGEIIAWVEIPTLQYDTDTTFYMVYGDSSVTTSQEDVAGAWNANFTGVWHLGEASGTRYDSTSNGNDLSDTNTVTTLTGQIGTAADFEAGNSESLRITDASQTDLDITGDFTYLGWVNWESTPGVGTLKTIFSKWRDDSSVRQYIMYLYNDSGTLRVQVNLSPDGAASEVVRWPWTPSTGTWYQLGLKIDVSEAVASEMELFIDGVSQGNGSVIADQSLTSINNGTGDFVIGAEHDSSNPFDGGQDSFRILNGTLLSDDWITTAYNNEDSPSTFYTMGSETSPNTAPDTPSITSPADTATSVVLNPTLTSSAFNDTDVGDTHKASQWLLSDDSGFTSTEWDSGVDTTNKVSIDVNSTNGTFGGTLSGESRLANDTQYWVKVRHQDNNDAWSAYSTAISFTTTSGAQLAGGGGAPPGAKAPRKIPGKSPRPKKIGSSVHRSKGSLSRHTMGMIKD